MVKNILGKGENAVYQHFSFSQNVFKSHLPLGHLKSGFCGKVKCVLTLHEEPNSFSSHQAFFRRLDTNGLELQACLVPRLFLEGILPLPLLQREHFHLLPLDQLQLHLFIVDVHGRQPHLQGHPCRA